MLWSLFRPTSPQQQRQLFLMAGTTAAICIVSFLAYHYKRIPWFEKKNNRLNHRRKKKKGNVNIGGKIIN